MAFHFDAKADSSEEEPEIDFSAWKPGVKSGIPPELLEASDEQNAETIELRPRETELERRGSRSPPMPSFTTINEYNDVRRIVLGEDAQSDLPTTPSVDFETREQEEEGLGRPQSTAPSSTLVIEIPHAEVDRDQYEDLTTGHDVVRRVIREIEDEQGRLVYKVLFEDFSTNEVSADKSP